MLNLEIVPYHTLCLNVEYAVLCGNKVLLNLNFEFWITRRVPNENDLNQAKFYENYYEFVSAKSIKQWIMCKAEFNS